ncbi:MAG: hypothetical protein RR880_07045, partial [Bacteroidales bacterium]
MKKYTLIKFYRGEASDKEIDSIINWVNKSEQNKEYFAKLKAVYTAMYLNTTKFTLDNKFSAKKPLLHRILYVSSVAAIAILFFTIGYFANDSTGE